MAADNRVQPMLGTVLRRFALPLTAAAVLTSAAFVALGMGGEWVLGNWEAGRLFPFSNAHLREESAEGLYAPLSDPLFVSFLLLIAVCGFGPSMFWGALRAPRAELWLVWLAAMCGIGLLALTLRSALSHATPSSISTAALFVLAACFGASAAGIGLSRFVSRAKQESWATQ